jgi:poly(3-hydroxybutyrate) depolymerase
MLVPLAKKVPGVKFLPLKRAVKRTFPRGKRMYYKFFNEITRPVTRPEWTTPNKIRLESKSVILRDFSHGNHPPKTPLIILPPQAGHHSNVADYGPGQSLVAAALAWENSVFVTEWKSATFARRYETIDNAILATNECVDAVRGKGKVTLVGLCQGGWQSAIYAALYPEKVENLVLAAAPIDFRADGGKIPYFVSIYPMFFYESLVAMGGGIMRGEYLKMGFKMLNPVDRFGLDFTDLYVNISNRDYLERSRKFRNWYEYTQNIPGRMYLQIVKELFKENKLIKGTLNILGRRVDLRNIRCPLILIAGDKDDITPREQLFNIGKYVSSEDIMKLVAPAGHIGVFMGSRTLEEYWPRIFKKISSYN